VRAVVQRCRAAWVEVAGREVGRIGLGLCALVAAGRGDGPEDVRYVADKLAHLRVFPAAPGAEGGERWAVSVREAGGAVLLVPQFTLYGDVRHGRRPDFGAAAPPAEGRVLLEDLAARLAEHGVPLAQGVFGADMTVHLVNWGPVTILLDSRRAF
jgi:D-tyrosyl-tRNA(Tyr) deacylase